MSVAFANREVLVLNKGWTAVGIVSLERAIVMLFSTCKDGTPKARIIDPRRDFQTFTWEDWSRLKPKSDEDAIHSGRDTFRIPKVILLSRYDKLPMQKVNFSRRTLFRRDNHTCQYCAKRIGGEEMTMDHILPRSRGGRTTWENVVVACWKCNAKKADRTPEECGMRLVTGCEKCAHVSTDAPGKHQCRHCKALRQFDTVRPKKPILPLCRKTAITCEDWKHFISEAYWNVEVDNDNKK